MMTKAKKEPTSGSRDLFRTFIWSIVALVIIRSFIFESFKIPTSSMVPTLHIGDHIFVSKFDYGLNLLFTKIELIRWSQPKRGDVIVFLNPRDESVHYVKRVIAIPGDKLEIRGREIFINEKKLVLQPVKDPLSLNEVFSGEPASGEIFAETIDGKSHWVRFLPAEEAGFQGMKQIETVPPDKFFVVGDNRDQSYDSRSWGFVSRENIKGKARMIWLSLPNPESLTSAKKVIWSRSGKRIQ